MVKELEKNLLIFTQINEIIKEYQSLMDLIEELKVNDTELSNYVSNKRYLLEEIQIMYSEGISTKEYHDMISQLRPVDSLVNVLNDFQRIVPGFYQKIVDKNLFKTISIRFEEILKLISALDSIMRTERSQV